MKNSKMSKKKIIMPIVIIVLLVAVGICLIPEVRVNLFVRSYHEQIEEGLAAGNGVPADDAVFFGYDAVNTWEGEHRMTEFVICSYGDTYYGCYYSPDDVPLAFQNVGAEITQDGHDYWEWEAEQGHYGSTSKIMENWYFFEVFNNVENGTANDDIELSDNVTSITVEYLGAGQIKRWSVSPDLIDGMMEWYSNLDYKKVDFKEGESPADGEGQAVYCLEFSNGTEFAYYNCGTEHYIRMADVWYKVKNPTLPPVGEPE